MPPYSGNKFDINLEPGQKACVLANVNGPLTDLNMKLKRLIHKDDKGLIEDCVANGNKKEREPGVFVYAQKYVNGYLFYYHNSSTDLLYTDETIFTVKDL